MRDKCQNILRENPVQMVTSNTCVFLDLAAADSFIIFLKLVWLRMLFSEDNLFLP